MSAPLRLVDWPSGLIDINAVKLAGPQSVNAGSTTSFEGYQQSRATPFGLWQYTFSFQIYRSAEARDYRGFVTALHEGANVTIVPFCDRHVGLKSDFGLSAETNVLWSNGQPFSNGQAWTGRYGNVDLAVAHTKGTTIVFLSPTFWGDKLQRGAWLGFGPTYFGKHKVVEVVYPGAYRIWPALRADLTTDMMATLYPRMAMKLAGPGAGVLSASRFSTDQLDLTLTEVLHEDVVAHAYR